VGLEVERTGSLQRFLEVGKVDIGRQVARAWLVEDVDDLVLAERLKSVS
jgi:hypothetical protein